VVCGAYAAKADREMSINLNCKVGDLVEQVSAPLSHPQYCGHLMKVVEDGGEVEGVVARGPWWWVIPAGDRYDRKWEPRCEVREDGSFLVPDCHLKPFSK
jgi:hypothetical protein